MSPVDLVKGTAVTRGVRGVSTLVALVLFAMVWPLGAYWPLSRLVLLPWLFGLAAVPWLGGWLTAWWRGDAERVAWWLRVITLGLLPLLTSMGPQLRFLHDMYMDAGREVDWGLETFCASAGFGLMALCASLLLGMAVRRWGSPMRAPRALQLMLRAVPVVLLAGGFGVVWAELHPRPVEFWRAPTAPYAVLECTVLATVVWALAWRGRDLLLGHMEAWRALPMVEVVVADDGLVTADGRRLQTGRALPLGAKVMAEDRQHLGDSHRGDAVWVERVVVADAAHWTEALEAAERHAMTAMALSLAFAAGMLFLELVVMW